MLAGGSTVFLIFGSPGAADFPTYKAIFQNLPGPEGGTEKNGKVHNVSRERCWTSGTSDKWHVGQVACRTSGMSDKWHVGQVRCRTSGMSDK